jgi:hypothetical protein
VLAGDFAGAASASGFLRRNRLTIVEVIAQNGAHGSTAPRGDLREQRLVNKIPMVDFDEPAY